MNRQELLDVLADLQHDLGKYIRLPISMLPRDASPAELREALATALLRTRQSPRGTRSARAIWQEFETEAGADARAYPSYTALEAAVERALAWEMTAAREAAVIDRAALESDLAAVSSAIRKLIEEVGP
jgi:hypothetical protein